VIKKTKMEKIKASLMTIALVLVAIAFIAPSSAVPVGNHDITFLSHSFDGTYSTWTYEVTSGSKPSLSHWDLTWCNEGAIVEVSEKPWEYGTDKHTGITGIKFDKGYNDEQTRIVWFKLRGDFPVDDVLVGTKAGKDNIAYGYVKGPVNCDTPIPEFSTIAIPIASILGLLFFFNYRKRRK
jgi:hypothetical protein